MAAVQDVTTPARSYCLQTEIREWDTCPVLGAPGYYLMCELWLELVQVQASFAPAMPLQVGRATGSAKATHSSEHQPGHLLSPKHWERTRLTCKSLHGDAMLNPSLAAFLVCLHLAL